MFWRDQSHSRFARESDKKKALFQRAGAQIDFFRTWQIFFSAPLDYLFFVYYNDDQKDAAPLDVAFCGNGPPFGTGI